jgi:hypothetical protein
MREYYEVFFFLIVLWITDTRYHHSFPIKSCALLNGDIKRYQPILQADGRSTHLKHNRVKPCGTDN